MQRKFNRVIPIILLLLVFGCATGPVQKSRFDKDGMMYGFVVNNSDNFIAIKVRSVDLNIWLRNGKALIIRPYWASVGSKRDYFEAPEPRKYDNRQDFNKPGDPRFKKVHPDLLKYSPRMNAARMSLSPGKYEVFISVIYLVDRTKFRMGAWKNEIITLKESQATPFTWEYAKSWRNSMDVIKANN